MTADLVRRTFRDLPVARVATVGADGSPHVAPAWFVWLEDGLFLSMRQGSATWDNVGRDPRVAVVIDRGRDWAELAGVRAEGTAEALAAEHPDAREAMSAWHEKYRSMLGGGGFERLAEDVPALGFLRVEVERLSTWDHSAS